MAFYPHLGSTGGYGYGVYTPLAMPTMDTILDTIVADVADAVSHGTNNGWTLYDDQRGGVTPNTSSLWAIPVFLLGGCDFAAAVGVNCTSGSTAVTNANTTNPTFVSAWTARWIAGTTKLVPAANYYNVASGSTAGWVPQGTTTHTVSAITNDYTATLGNNWSYVTTTGTGATSPTNTHFMSRQMMELSQGYIILQCVGSSKTFYVAIIRPNNYSNGCIRCQVWETWNNATHTGTYPSNQEELRVWGGGAAQKVTNTTSIQYILWLLPNSFALWAQGNPWAGYSISADVYVCGISAPTRNDDIFLYAGCTWTALSGCSAMARLSDSNGYVNGAFNNCPMQVNTSYVGVASSYAHRWNMQAQFVSSTNNTLTWYSGGQFANVRAAGQHILNLGGANITTMNSDPNGVLQMTVLELHENHSQGANGLPSWAGWLGKRGEIPYLKVPVQAVNNNRNLWTFGPADDGHTYLYLATTGPICYNNFNTYSRNPTYINGASADVLCGTYYANLTSFSSGRAGGGVAFSANTIAGEYETHHYFLLPIDV